MKSWAEQGGWYHVQNEVQDEIENMVTSNKISSPVHVRSGICKHKAKFYNRYAPSQATDEVYFSKTVWHDLVLRHKKISSAAQF